MKYSIYQIHLDEVASANIEASGWSAAEYNPLVKAYLDKDMNCQAAVDSGFYKLVASVDAFDLEDVFKAGNIEHERLEVVDRFHSVSVGDMIIDENRSAVVVAPFGFEEVNV